MDPFLTWLPPVITAEQLPWLGYNQSQNEQSQAKCSLEKSSFPKLVCFKRHFAKHQNSVFSNLCLLLQKRDFELTSKSLPKLKTRAQKQKDNTNKINPNKERLKRHVFITTTNYNRNEMRENINDIELVFVCSQYCQ